MRTKILVLAMCIFTLTTAASAQTPRREDAPISATTVDGRSVILRSDGTWTFTAKADAAGSFDIEAAVIYKSGEVMPVARTTFYLLRENAAQVIATEQMTSLYKEEASKIGLSNESPSLGSLFGALRYPNLYPNFTARAWRAIEAETVVKVQTDFTGKGTFQNIPVGRYYIVGIAQTRRSFIAWNLEVTVPSGKVVLDPNNATVAF